MQLISAQKKTLLAAILLLIGGTALALPDDREQAILIQSDQAERDELKGTTTYSGSVLMEQGSMKITAAKVVIYSKGDKVSKLVASGTPAQYSQLPAPGDAPVVAKANVLEYQVDKETLFLIDNAFLEQEGSSLSGNRIEYDVKKALVRASGNTQTSTGSQRVRMVIPPQSLQSQSDENSEAKKPPASSE